MEEKPNYYAIIPAEIRYDSELKSTEKLLYAEISALTGKEGICWATNNYFAKLYNVTPHYISTLIGNLEKQGHIRTELIYKGKEVKQRNIYLLHKSVIPITQKCNTPITQKCKDNNININNINRINNIKKFENDFIDYDLESLYVN